MHPERSTELQYSFALVRKIPGAAPGEEASLPHVFEIISRKSKFARRIGLESMKTLPQDVVVKGIDLTMIRLYSGQQYFQYQVDDEGRGAYFVSRMHGEDDGHLGTSSLVRNSDIPTAVSAKTPQPMR